MLHNICLLCRCVCLPHVTRAWDKMYQPGPLNLLFCSSVKDYQTEAGDGCGRTWKWISVHCSVFNVGDLHTFVEVYLQCMEGSSNDISIWHKLLNKLAILKLNVTMHLRNISDMHFVGKGQVISCRSRKTDLLVKKEMLFCKGTRAPPWKAWC